MKVAVAQINSTVGDFSGNARKVLSACERAAALGATLVVTPEMAISGYPPEDLLLRDDFMQQCESTVQDLAASVQGVTLILGHPRRVGANRHNSASVIENGIVLFTYNKQRLPNYLVFDEERYFEPGSRPLVFQHLGRRIGVVVCEDFWFPEPAAQARAAGAEVLVTINASPYDMTKLDKRYDEMRDRVRETGLPLLYVHCIGGQDELVFDGASFALDGTGKLTYQAVSFEEALDVIEFDGHAFNGPIAAPLTLEASVYKALGVALRDYVNKNGFPGVLLGLSGGVDSALVLSIAVDALGNDRVKAVMMPSDYTASMSVEDAREIAGNLGVDYSEIAIKPMFDSFAASLKKEFTGRDRHANEDTTEENLQARIRGTLLMAMSNKFGSMVVTTGNKSEMAVGYATLYGDMAGGFAVIKDILKTLVYRLCNYRNGISRVIPQRIIDRAPSAELRPDQTDQDSLPPYDILDAIIERFMERDLSPESIIAEGFDAEYVRQVVRLIQISEYKRRQAPVGVKVTPRGFGKDWRYPITSRYRPQ